METLTHVSRQTWKGDQWTLGELSCLQVSMGNQRSSAFFCLQCSGLR